MALRVAQSNAPEIGRSHAASPDRFSVQVITGAIAVLAALSASTLQKLAASGNATSLMCGALLVFGLPHGSLDVALIRRSAQLGGRRLGASVAIYLGLAAAMYAVWCLVPVLALGGFLLIASVHFAEDWKDRLPPFFAIGTAVALLTSPALLHHREINDIFVTLSGQGGAATVAELSVLVAPVALVAAAVGLWLMTRSGRWVSALETALVLAGMVLLPPVAGFALFFCLSHSPRHFVAARAELGGHDGEAALLTFAALGIAALIYATRSAVVFEDKAIFASFVTLSVLTVPHMMVPWIMNRQRKLPI